MSSGRIAHILITDVNIHFLLPVFQKPQSHFSCLLQSCLLEVCCLCDCFILLLSLLTSLWFWGCCSGVMGAGTHLTLGCLQCWDVLPLPFPKTFQVPSFHDPSTLSFPPSQSPGSTQNTQSSPDCAGLLLLQLYRGVLSVPCICCSC